MRYVVTCFLEQKQSSSFIVFGSSMLEATATFEKTLKEANLHNGYVKLCDGMQVKIDSILAYRIDREMPLF